MNETSELVYDDMKIAYHYIFGAIKRMSEKPEVAYQRIMILCGYALLSFSKNQDVFEKNAKMIVDNFNNQMDFAIQEMFDTGEKRDEYVRALKDTEDDMPPFHILDCLKEAKMDEFFAMIHGTPVKKKDEC